MCSYSGEGEERGNNVGVITSCLTAQPRGCESNDECADNLTCVNRKCINPCELKPCESANATCSVTNHEVKCSKYSGRATSVLWNTVFIVKLFIFVETIGRIEFSKPEMVVSCLSDGVQVRMGLSERDFSGVLYVKGHSKEEECRKLISVPKESSSKVEIFKVLFGTCGLIHINVSTLIPLFLKSRIRGIFFLIRLGLRWVIYRTIIQR